MRVFRLMLSGPPPFPSRASPIPTSTRLELQFQAKLDKARIACGCYVAKIRARYISVWVKKLRVIEEIENLGTKFKAIAFAKRCPFDGGEVPVVRRRAGKEVMPCIADGS